MSRLLVTSVTDVGHVMHHLSRQIDHLWATPQSRMVLVSAVLSPLCLLRQHHAEYMYLYGCMSTQAHAVRQLAAAQPQLAGASAPNLMGLTQQAMLLPSSAHAAAYQLGQSLQLRGISQPFITAVSHPGGVSAATPQHFAMLGLQGALPPRAGGALGQISVGMSGQPLSAAQLLQMSAAGQLPQGFMISSDGGAGPVAPGTGMIHLPGQYLSLMTTPGLETGDTAGAGAAVTDMSGTQHIEVPHEGVTGMPQDVAVAEGTAVAEGPDPAPATHQH